MVQHEARGAVGVAGRERTRAAGVAPALHDPNEFGGAARVVLRTAASLSSAEVGQRGGVWLRMVQLRLHVAATRRRVGHESIPVTFDRPGQRDRVDDQRSLPGYKPAGSA